MNREHAIVSEATIQNGLFVAVGRGVRGALSPCTRVIDLRGRTAVPGLIDNHNHIVLLGLRPGHDTRLETAASIADVQAAIKVRAASVPPGEFVTAMGGWNPAQFAEQRLPTLAEYLSASSVPRFRSASVWAARSALSAAIDGVLAGMSPASLTAILCETKKALPLVLVTEGPLKAKNTRTG